jgi:hypothetical protein
MIKNEVKDTYTIIDYLLDLDTYYNSIIVKYLNKKLSIKLDKRYKNNSKKMNDKINNIDNMLKYYGEKHANVNAMIKKIEDGDVKKIELEFM